ncbi:hypothetical protein OPQ81_000389 [Rhizoctonia solani]|nr:hypothetical protein OPQ81_000389 [Rhizoctonia solani]
MYRSSTSQISHGEHYITCCVVLRLGSRPQSQRADPSSRVCGLMRWARPKARANPMRSDRVRLASALGAYLFPPEMSLNSYLWSFQGFYDLGRARLAASFVCTWLG